jgi:hypothetical protein
VDVGLPVGHDDDLGAGEFELEEALDCFRRPLDDDAFRLLLVDAQVVHDRFYLAAVGQVARL